jgi:HNH endonuclease/NUMOD4 motif-containing protein
VDEANEIWKPLPMEGAEGRYEVSDQGRARALYFHRRGKLYIGARMLKGYTSGRGYLKVSVTRNGHGDTSMPMHRLVLLTFHGPCPTGYQGAHLNGNSLDNRAVNLQWVTPKENSRHRVAHGTQARGSGNGQSVLDERAVSAIRRLKTDGVTQLALARAFSVSESLVGMICRGEGWTHVA